MLSAFRRGPGNPFLFEGEGHGDSLLNIPPLGSLEMTLQVNKYFLYISPSFYQKFFHIIIIINIILIILILEITSWI